MPVERRIRVLTLNVIFPRVDGYCVDLMNSLRTKIAVLLTTLCVGSICANAQEDPSIWEGQNLAFRSLPVYQESPPALPNLEPLVRTGHSESSVDNSFDQAFDRAYEVINGEPSAVDNNWAMSQDRSRFSSVRNQLPSEAKTESLAQQPQAPTPNPSVAVQNFDQISKSRIADRGNPGFGEMTPLPAISSDSENSALPSSRFEDTEDEYGALWWQQMVMQPLSPNNATEHNGSECPDLPEFEKLTPNTGHQQGSNHSRVASIRGQIRI